MDILSSNKVLQLEPLAPLIRQGERLADNPVFVLPKMRDGIDQTALAWEIRATSDHDTIVIQSLTADLTGTDIRLPWVVEGEFTAVAGALYITLCGKSATSDIVVKYVGSTALRVLAAEEGAYAPPPNIAEQTYQQRAAAEAAAASADATLAQTQALKDQVQVIVAGNEAHTKSESNARFAGALVVKESGNPITVYPDATGAPLTAISQRGKTNQPGTGDPSPTNIRPIYGVGQFDKKLVLNGTESWAMSSVTIGMMILSIADIKQSTPCLSSTYLYAEKATTEKGLFYTINGQIRFLTNFDNVAAWKANLSSSNLQVYYQSTNYATATQVYCGLSITDANGYHGYAAGSMAPLYDGDTVDFGSGNVSRDKGMTIVDGLTVKFTPNSTGSFWNLTSGSSPGVGDYPYSIASTNGSIISSHFTNKIGGAKGAALCWTTPKIIAGLFDTVDALNQFCAEQYTAGTPLTLVYKRTSPITETVPISEPITYAPGPITIAAENTVDVTYNKSLAKAFEQITAAIASLGTV